MPQQSNGLYNSAYLLVSITLLLSLPTLADTGDISASSSNSQPAVKPLERRANKALKTSLDETLELETAPEITTDEPEPKSDLQELQELLSHEQESHMHLDGEIMLNDDASITHPALQDINGFEIDITIDFE